MATRIVAVIHRDGTPARCGEIWGRSNAPLFEIVDAGPDYGKRGPDTELYALVGPVLWDREHVSIYESGNIEPAAL